MATYRKRNRTEPQTPLNAIAVSGDGPSIDSYLARLRKALQRTGRFDLAETELILEEMRTHIHLLCRHENSVDGARNGTAANAVSLMDDPDRLADMWADADREALNFNPLNWGISRIQSWMRFLDIGAALQKAALVSAFAALAAYVIATTLPSSLQEKWLVPLNAFAVAWLACVLTSTSYRYALLSSVLFAGGATGATFLTETVASSGARFGLGLSYAAMAAALAASIALSFSLARGRTMRLIADYCMLAWPLLFTSFLASSLLVRFVIGGDHAVMYIFFVSGGVLLLAALERYWRARHPELQCS